MKNIKFIKTNDGETCEIDKQDESLGKTCQLLKVDAKQMNESLSQMIINNEKEVYHITVYIWALFPPRDRVRDSEH